MVDTNAALPSLGDLLTSNSAPALSFANAKIGDSFTGIITDAEAAQVRDYDTNEPKFWPDGNPQMQVILTLDTEYRDPAKPEDEGVRKAYLAGQKLTALKAALKEINRGGVENGDIFTITFDSTKPASNKKYNDVKIYKITIEPGKSNPAVDKLLASVGAKEVTPASAKLDAESVEKIKKLQASDFNIDEIAAMTKLTTEQVSDVINGVF